MKKLTVAIVVPTYKREKPLIDTLQCLFQQTYPLDTLIVVDQTEEHTPEVAALLAAFESERRIVWLRPPFIDFASLTKARNVGLKHANTDLVVFVDDDVAMDAEFVAEHVARFADPTIAATAGRVVVPHHIYPDTEPKRIAGISWFGAFINHFYGRVEADCEGFVGCNFCLRRSVLSEVGMFDERFIGNAMREETDMAIRIRRAGYRIRFVPSAHVDHLMDPAGGTRSDARRQWYFAFFANHFLFYGKHFRAFRIPFFILHLWRPIIACGLFYGKGRPSWITTPWSGILFGLRAAKASKREGMAILQRRAQ